MSYDLSWTELRYSVLYRKGSREFPFHLILSPISEAELVQLERHTVRTHAVQGDGSTITEIEGPPGQECPEETLFDAHFLGFFGASSNGHIEGRTVEELRRLVPAAVKRAAINNCVGGIKPKTVRVDSVKLEDLADNSVVLVTTVNGEEHELTHEFSEPSGMDEIDFRRASGGRIKTLPGRRRPEFRVLEQFEAYPKLYDRLIESVSGYIVGGDSKLSQQNKASWVHLIPYAHKKVAVLQLFGSAEAGGGDEPGER